MKEKHSEEVINYCIDNQVTFAEGYCAIIDQKLQLMKNNLHSLRRDVEFEIEDIQFDSIEL